MKQLKQEEIDQLFSFVKEKGLKYYDIQIEVVDHFASSIEANWESYPKHWTFEQKVLSIYEELGNNGFRNIVSGKTKMVMRRSYKLAFNHLKDAFKFPQFFVTMIMIYCLQQVFLGSEKPYEIFGKGILFPSIFLFITTFLLYVYYVVSFKTKNHAFEQSFSFLLLWQQIPLLSLSLIEWRDFPYSSTMYLLISTMLIFYIILSIGSFIVLWKIFLIARNRYEPLSKT